MINDNARTITCSVCGCEVRGVCTHLGLAELSEALADAARLTRELASISEEFGLPPTIRPAEGEIRRFMRERTQWLAERDEARAVLRAIVRPCCVVCDVLLDDVWSPDDENPPFCVDCSPGDITDDQANDWRRGREARIADVARALGSRRTEGEMAEKWTAEESCRQVLKTIVEACDPKALAQADGYVFRCVQDQNATIERLTRERDEARFVADETQAAAETLQRERDAARAAWELEKREHDEARAEAASQRSLLAELICVVPDTYGEAVQSGIIAHGECENHEWDNRTRAENAVWLINRRTRERDDARAVVRQLEWCEPEGGELHPWCPWCRRLQPVGHAPDCPSRGRRGSGRKEGDT